MIYTIYCDQKVIYDSRGEELACENVKVSLEVNAAGSLEFTMPPTHPNIDDIEIMASTLRVFRDKVEIFRGRPTEISISFFGKKKVYCEGVLAFLNDSIQRQGEYHDITPYNYLNTLLTTHNSQVEDDRKIYIGTVTVVDSNDSLYRYTNYNSTLQEIKEDLLDDLGGYLFPRFAQDGKVYLDYLADYPGTCTQQIVFGLNLLDYTRGFNVSDICTRVIPLGAKVNDPTYPTLGERLTIASINQGKDYIQSDDAVATFGIISKVVVWDNVTTEQALLSKAQKYLADAQYDNLVIEARAVDLHMTDDEIEAFELGDVVNVKSVPHGLDRNFPVTKMVLDLNSASNNSITLNAGGNKKISSIVGGSAIVGTGSAGSVTGGGSGGGSGVADGVYFRPAVDADGWISWTNNGGLQNPTTMNIKGGDGTDGTDGADGKSAYELAIDEGYTGTEAEWLASLDGTDGQDGEDGKSAYELAVEAGYSGTEAQWLESLHGEDGISARIAVAGTLYAADWDSREYSFEETYPSSTYNLEIELDGDRATERDFETFGEAKIVGSATENKCKALGTVPEVDLPIIIQLEVKGG